MYWPLVLELLASRTVKKLILVVKTNQFMVFCYSSLSKQVQFSETLYSYYISSIEI